MTDLVARYAARSVPRYTSYPTAKDFTSTVGSAETARWLGRLPRDEAISLYVHVPYCREICAYCACHAKATRKDAPVVAYLDTLRAEIALVRNRLPGRLPVNHVAFGGGTPSILGTEGLGTILADLEAAFDISPGAERAIELDPRHLGPTLAKGLASLGFTRTSLGVQDVDPRVQFSIGRVQPFHQVDAAFAELRHAGIDRINCDLLYGLPHQSEWSVQKTCARLASLGPDRLAIYGYAHMPDRLANQRLVDAVNLPGPSTRFALAAMIETAWRGAGYVPVGIDHFARPGDPLAQAARSGKLRRNFQGYTDDDCRTLIGFGASAVSSLPGGFAQNAAPVDEWRRAIEVGGLATRRGHATLDEDRVRAQIIEGLMCNFSADLPLVTDLFPDELALLRPLAADGIVSISGGKIAMTEAGRPFVRLVATIFDRFRSEADTGFSAAL